MSTLDSVSEDLFADRLALTISSTSLLVGEFERGLSSQSGKVARFRDITLRVAICSHLARVSSEKKTFSSTSLPPRTYSPLVFPPFPLFLSLSRKRILAGCPPPASPPDRTSVQRVARDQFRRRSPCVEAVDRKAAVRKLHLYKASGLVRVLGTAHIAHRRARRPALKDAYDDYPGFQNFEAWKGCIVGAVNVSHSLPNDASKVKNVFSETIEFDVLIPIKGTGGERRVAAASRLSARARCKPRSSPSSFLSVSVLQTRVGSPPSPPKPQASSPHDPVPADKSAQRVVSVPKPVRKRPRGGPKCSCNSPTRRPNASPRRPPMTSVRG